MILDSPVYDGDVQIIDTTTTKEKPIIFSKEKSNERNIIKDWVQFTQNIHSKNLHKIF